MTANGPFPIVGGCACGAVRYQMLTPPLFVHCCHCYWCQRETGTAFALNAMIESERVAVQKAVPVVVHTPSNSGRGQRISRCALCSVAVWSNYAGAGDAIAFIRVGTLDEPFRVAPDIHIYTSSKQPWVVLPAETPAVAAFYELDKYWPRESLERIATLRARRQNG